MGFLQGESQHGGQYPSSTGHGGRRQQMDYEYTVQDPPLNDPYTSVDRGREIHKERTLTMGRRIDDGASSRFEAAQRDGVDPPTARKGMSWHRDPHPLPPKPSSRERPLYMDLWSQEILRHALLPGAETAGHPLADLKTGWRSGSYSRNMRGSCMPIRIGVCL